MKGLHGIPVRMRTLLLVLLIALSIHLGWAFLLSHKGAAISAVAGGAAVALIFHLGMLAPLVALLRRRSGK